jgi:hypothetical protein
MENPAVKCNLLSYKLCELYEPLGQLTQYEAHETLEESPAAPKAVFSAPTEAPKAQSAERADSFNHSL